MVTRGPWGEPSKAGAVSGFWRLALAGGAAGFGVVAVLANFDLAVKSSWANVVRALGGSGLSTDATGTMVGRASVIDGDTIDIRGTRIRFSGIDAPESKQSCRDRSGADYACGRRAAFALADKIGAQNLSCQIQDHDKYGRSVATCALGSVDLNGWMVSSGWALAYRQYSTAYVGAEAEAETAKLGMWEGEFTPPWEWRHSHGDERVAKSSGTTPAASQADGAGCVIKGNISARGERIFHVPGQQYYASTTINAAAGERWFCSKAEAVAAGWRASKL